MATSRRQTGYIVAIPWRPTIAYWHHRGRGLATEQQHLGNTHTGHNATINGNWASIYWQSCHNILGTQTAELQHTGNRDAVGWPSTCKRLQHIIATTAVHIAVVVAINNSDADHITTHRHHRPRTTINYPSYDVVIVHSQTTSNPPPPWQQSTGSLLAIDCQSTNIDWQTG